MWSDWLNWFTASGWVFTLTLSDCEGSRCKGSDKIGNNNNDYYFIKKGGFICEADFIHRQVKVLYMMRRVGSSSTLHCSVETRNKSYKSSLQWLCRHLLVLHLNTHVLFTPGEEECDTLLSSGLTGLWHTSTQTIFTHVKKTFLSIFFSSLTVFAPVINISYFLRAAQTEKKNLPALIWTYNATAIWFSILERMICVFVCIHFGFFPFLKYCFALPWWTCFEFAPQRMKVWRLTDGEFCSSLAQHEGGPSIPLNRLHKPSHTDAEALSHTTRGFRNARSSAHIGQAQLQLKTCFVNPKLVLYNVWRSMQHGMCLCVCVWVDKIKGEVELHSVG